MPIYSTLDSLQNRRMTEPEKKADALETYEQADPDTLSKWRTWARSYVYSNGSMRDHHVPNIVNADSLRAHFGITALPFGGNSILGQVFRKGFVKCFPMQSKTKGRHASMIWAWTLPEYKETVAAFLKKT